MHRALPAPLKASPGPPLAASARRSRFVGIRDTRNRFATSRSLALASLMHLLPAGLLSRGHPTAIGGYLMPFGIPQGQPAIGRTRNLRHQSAAVVSARDVGCILRPSPGLLITNGASRATGPYRRSRLRGGASVRRCLTAAVSCVAALAAAATSATVVGQGASMGTAGRHARWGERDLRCGPGNLSAGGPLRSSK